MPIAHRFDAALNTLFLEISGAVTDAELLDMARSLASDKSVPDARRELIDLSGIEHGGVDVSGDALRTVAQLFAASDERPEECRVAIVAPGDLDFGLSRMYQAFREPSPLPIRVFREVGEARRWLEIED